MCIRDSGCVGGLARLRACIHACARSCERAHAIGPHACASAYVHAHAHLPVGEGSAGQHNPNARNTSSSELPAVSTQRQRG
eukprot:12835530-Alexandrium_andersonii.AAC.1